MLRYRLLGPLDVAADGHHIDIGAGRPAALLALLLLHRNEVVSADHLIDDLWEDGPPATAAKRLQVCVSHLRRDLTDGGVDASVLRTVAGGYALDVADDELDIVAFEDAVADVRRDLEDGQPERAAARAQSALALWRGTPFADFRYEHFAQAEIARLEEQRLALLEARIDAALALGRHGEIIGELEQLVEEHPLHERFSAQLMLALYRTGRQADALATYRGLRGVLSHDLGLEPLPELRALEESVLHHDPGIEAPRDGRLGRSRRPSAAAREQSPPIARRAAQLLIVGGALLAGAGGLAIMRRTESRPAPVPALGSVSHMLAALDGRGDRAQVLFPVAGTPTGLAAGRDAVWAVTVDPSQLVEVSTRTHAIRRVVPLPGRPDAVAVTATAVWVLDAGHERITRVRATDAATSTIRYRRTVQRSPVGHPAMAPAGAGVWISDGGRTLFRVSDDGSTVGRVVLNAPIDDIAALGQTVWALDARAGRVLRVDAQRRRVVETVPLPGSHPAGATFPAHIAVTRTAVWTLCGRIPVLARIDPLRHAAVLAVRFGRDRFPADLAADARSVWVADRDGTLTRLDPANRTTVSRRIADGLTYVTLSGGLPWAATA